MILSWIHNIFFIYVFNPIILLYLLFKKSKAKKPVNLFMDLLQVKKKKKDKYKINLKKK